MTRRILLTLLAFLLLTPVAQATVLTGATPLQQQWLAESQLPQPDITITVEDRECLEPPWQASACYKPKSATLVVDDYSHLFEDPGVYPESERRNTRLLFLHEVGHAADFDDDGFGQPAPEKRAYRIKFGRIMGYGFGPNMRYRTKAADSKGRWNFVGGTYVAEQFAQAYAYCANDRYWLDPTLLIEFPGYGYQPTQAQHKRVCRLIVKWL